MAMVLEMPISPDVSESTSLGDVALGVALAWSAAQWVTGRSTMTDRPRLS